MPGGWLRRRHPHLVARARAHAERGDVELRDVGEAEFKGLDGRHRLFEVTWTPAATPTLTDDAPTTSQAE
jgi:hypothetical protein